jgi:hypothetical protein
MIRHGTVFADGFKALKVSVVSVAYRLYIFARYILLIGLIDPPLHIIPHPVMIAINSQQRSVVDLGIGLRGQSVAACFPVDRELHGIGAFALILGLEGDVGIFKSRKGMTLYLYCIRWSNEPRYFIGEILSAFVTVASFDSESGIMIFVEGVVGEDEA